MCRHEDQLRSEIAPANSLCLQAWPQAGPFPFRRLNSKGKANYKFIWYSKVSILFVCINKYINTINYKYKTYHVCLQLWLLYFSIYLCQNTYNFIYFLSSPEEIFFTAFRGRGKGR